MADPLESLDLVQQPEVAGRALLFHHLRSCQEAKNAESVAHIDADDAVAGVAFAAVVPVPGLAGLQGAAVDECFYLALIQQPSGC